MRKITKIESQGIHPVKRKRVAAYVRVSSGKEAQLHSLSAQISYYNSYIGSRGDWELAGIYADEAMTGTKAGRPQFQKMLADCRSGKIDMVIAKSITRLARNTVTLLETARELKTLDVDIYFEKEQIHTLSSDGELMLTLLASFAQEESRSVSENVKWRVRKKFEQGLPVNGNAFGYRLKDGIFQVIPEEAAIVRQIFNDFLSGMGLNAIVKKLNLANARPQKGGKWNESTIHGILHNEKYTGDLLLQKYYRVDHISKRHVPNRGELPQYLVKDNHPAIISHEVFDQVQRELERRAVRFGIPRGPHKINLFTGLIHCGLCGKNFRRKIANAGKQYEKPVWCCSTFNTRGKNECPSQQIPEDILTAKTMEVLGLSEINREILLREIQEIQVPGHNILIYVFHDRQTKETHWQNPSRRESWTPERRQRARERELERIKQKRKEGGA